MRRRPRPARTLVSRMAIASAAGLAVVASGGTAALAEDSSPADEIAPGDSSSVTEDDTTPETPVEETPETPAETQPEGTETAEPGTDSEAGDDAAEETGDEAAQPLVLADYGTQKVRIGVQQADGSWLSPSASLLGTTMSITITGVTDDEGQPLPDETTSCVVEFEDREDEGDAYADCDVVSDEDGSLYLEAGESATITVTSVPTGVVIAPTTQVVNPCLTDDCPSFPDATFVDFDASSTPAAISASTPAGQPVVLDVVGPIDFGLDNAVTGLTVTSQPGNGTAVVTGDLPPVPEEPVDPEGPGEEGPGGGGPVPELALAQAPVVAAAPSGTARIVFTPNAGFVGTNTFGYAIATQNGTLTGTATITVTAAAVTPPVVTSPVGSGLGTGTGRPVRAGGTLPSTGGPAAELLALGAVLVVAGAGVGTMAARRRSDRERALVG
ncbi:hypothetical protein [Aeromicrobium sp. Leaf350]|uniref:hypothetical protein n=1 Tax=Aeromicrobium sp. Leaf350 TaxID=2876565 RepID=UPI001E386DE3|nr:hypothetical protein [Aeromicrobium sp. Leaf350]